MAEHQRASQKKQEKVDEKHRTIRKESQPSLDHVHAWGQGVVPTTKTPFSPRMEEHAELLTMVPSDEHRANLVLHLQQTYGNRYVQRLLNSKAVQAKLTVSSPNDVYEQEADRVAKVVTMADNSQAQRQQEEEEELQMKASQVQRESGLATQRPVNTVPGTGLSEHIVQRATDVEIDKYKKELSKIEMEFVTGSAEFGGRAINAGQYAMRLRMCIVLTRVLAGKMRGDKDYEPVLADVKSLLEEMQDAVNDYLPITMKDKKEKLSGLIDEAVAMTSVAAVEEEEEGGGVELGGYATELGGEGGPTYTTEGGFEAEEGEEKKWGGVELGGYATGLGEEGGPTYTTEVGEGPTYTTEVGEGLALFGGGLPASEEEEKRLSEAGAAVKSAAEAGRSLKKTRELRPKELLEEHRGEFGEVHEWKAPGGGTVEREIKKLKPEQLRVHELKIVEAGKKPRFKVGGNYISTTEYRSMFGMPGRKGGKAIFVMDAKDGKLYVGDQMNIRFEDGEWTQGPEDWEFGEVFHSSFLGGGDVAAAGELEFEDGVLTGISDKSGHYQPETGHTLQLLQVFEENGVDLKNVPLELYAYATYQKRFRRKGTPIGDLLHKDNPVFIFADLFLKLCQGLTSNEEICENLKAQTKLNQKDAKIWVEEGVEEKAEEEEEEEEEEEGPTYTTEEGEGPTYTTEGGEGPTYTT